MTDLWLDEIATNGRDLVSVPAEQETTETETADGITMVRLTREIATQVITEQTHFMRVYFRMAWRTADSSRRTMFRAIARDRGEIVQDMNKYLAETATPITA